MEFATYLQNEVIFDIIITKITQEKAERVKIVSQGWRVSLLSDGVKADPVGLGYMFRKLLQANLCSWHLRQATYWLIKQRIDVTEYIDVLKVSMQWNKKTK